MPLFTDQSADQAMLFGARVAILQKKLKPSESSWPLVRSDVFQPFDGTIPGNVDTMQKWYCHEWQCFCHNPVAQDTDLDCLYVKKILAIPRKKNALEILETETCLHHTWQNGMDFSGGCWLVKNRISSDVAWWELAKIATQCGCQHQRMQDLSWFYFGISRRPRNHPLRLGLGSELWWRTTSPWASGIANLVMLKNRNVVMYQTGDLCHSLMTGFAVGLFLWDPFDVVWWFIFSHSNSIWLNW